ncbi:UDP-N-acetylmuramoyl-L-alanyl-D-glutamate--2,6-diaminopimelate ligase [Bacillus lacus]|uniref:UDP-N-acetylmuramoyl-L-alanyl-D-glutamate--2, 6-diaminopimelate ligase n=1 Tax=Metabacillus lacus TaxID=1983721 RepID=A0A7X2M048_9BACI|nr:UDP-N-acetylmuramoyl-L-alanyl-D-glutamate--2,6-diaminopimelate ligase [Metabacillus lacus]MRX73703.1 UDP-N-acetylmuramoyl-L-alanyl-D-glutamate--2,6-diaminopimelate ligase [Metabacillus lacus]
MITFDFEKAEIHFLDLFGPPAQHISRLSFHSKQISYSAAFFSIVGEDHDGHGYIEEAIQRGAKTIIGTDLSVLRKLSAMYQHCTFLAVENVRKAMAQMAKIFYEHADASLKTIGVTGTNGKTTVAAYTRSLLTLLGLPSGSIGTTGIWSSKQKLNYKKSTPTTPESIDLHRIFQDLYNRGDKAAAMEVSSIALDQLRVEGITFDVAIHTNLSEEHLEYHKTFENYKQCKLKLFHQAKHAVVNLDDHEMGKMLSHTFNGPAYTYAIHNELADLLAKDITYSEKGTSFQLLFNGYPYQASAPIFGEYNVCNLLAAICTALHLGFQMEEITAVLPYLEGPEGRFEVLEGPEQRRIILDYAHTPVALTRLVEEVKKLSYNRLIVMIAGIGIRDFNKMPKMAAAIEGKADEIVVTVDHPGYHDPKLIIDQVKKGFNNPNAVNIHQTLTREIGVIKALNLAGPNDIILLTSGCINGAQIVKGQEVPHSDEAIIQEYFALNPA